MSRFPTAGHLISWAGLCHRSLHLARTDQIVGNHGLCERYANWGWWPKNIGCGRSGQVIMGSN
jgi:hypothetical protein